MDFAVATIFGVQVQGSSMSVGEKARRRLDAVNLRYPKKRRCNAAPHHAKCEWLVPSSPNQASALDSMCKCKERSVFMCMFEDLGTYDGLLNNVNDRHWPRRTGHVYDDSKQSSVAERYLQFQNPCFSKQASSLIYITRCSFLRSEPMNCHKLVVTRPLVTLENMCTKK